MFSLTSVTESSTRLVSVNWLVSERDYHFKVSSNICNPALWRLCTPDLTSRRFPLKLIVLLIVTVHQVATKDKFQLFKVKSVSVTLSKLQYSTFMCTGTPAL